MTFREKTGGKYKIIANTAFLFILVTIIALTFSVQVSAAENNLDESTTNNSTEEAAIENSDFVYRQGDKLMFKGEEFRFVGTNNYYFHYKDKEMVDDVIENAASMGIRVIRIWGFMEGAGNIHDGHVMQSEPGIYDESGFENLDYAIKKAGEEGIKLVIVLTNNWDDFGGMNQYVKWFDSASTHDDFYTNKEIKQLYKDYINYMLNRENTLTGIIYKEDPTVMTWELANEPRLRTDKSGKKLTAWIAEMSEYIKSIDSRHLVAAGDEGFFNRNSSTYGYGGYEGVDWERIIRIPSIDYGTYHLYPEHWGWDEDIPGSGLAWIRAHLKAAAEAGKPAVLEEYGVSSGAAVDRDYVYDIWNNEVYRNGGTGSMFWILTGIDTSSGADKDGLYPDYDGFRVVAGSSTAELISDYATLFNTGEDNRKPAVYIDTPAEKSELKGIVQVKARIMPRGKYIKNVYFSTSGVVDSAKMKVVGENYYTIDWNTNSESEGKNIDITIRAELLGGADISRDITVKVRNGEAEYVVGKTFDFNNGLEGWRSAGTYQAEYLKPELEHSDFNGGSMKVNINWPGISDWEEIKLARSVDNLSDYIKVSYDLYIPAKGLNNNSYIKSFFSLNWEKIALGDNDIKVADAERIKLEGIEFLKINVSSEYRKRTDKSELELGLVGSKLPYKGPVFVDNIKLIKKL